MKKEWIQILCATLALVLIIVIGVVVATNGGTKDAVGTEQTEETEVTEVFATEEVFETEIKEVTETTEVEEVVEIISVSMTASSMEKDLKVKIVDENNKLITGHPFVITVTPEGQDAGKEHSDNNMNGIIYIDSLEPGKYTVQLHELEGFLITENIISAVVKEQIVYEKVEIENEIKDESEIDSSKEDTANKDIVVEDEIIDTLPFLESDIIPTEVEKGKVDFSNFPVAEVGAEKTTLVLNKVVQSADSTETILATAEVALPKTATLYRYGQDASKKMELELDVTDQAGIIKEITWSVDGDESIDFVVSDDKFSASLVAKKDGTAKVSVVISYEATESDAAVLSLEDAQEITCTITVGDYTDDKTQLKDTEGNLLYLDEEAKVLATPKDFSAAEKFYGTPKYIGWQTINGKAYYYKEDHTVATGRQIIGKVTYDFNADGSLIEKKETIGIDVSKWNGEIDWKAVAGAGVDFVIIRCGYRGSSTGVLVEDPYFKQNIEGATKNGIKVGVYFYTQAITEAEAIEEASMALSLVQGYRLQLPIFIDTEQSKGRGDKLSKEERTAVVKAFCETVKSAGYKAGVYSGKSWYEEKLNANELGSYHIWVARYAKECGYAGHYDIWQHSDKGQIPGIKGNVDLNISYTSYY